MGIKIDQSRAYERLEEATRWAESGRPVPEDWYTFSRQVFSFQAKTYTAALGTALLARATNDRIDPLSIKEAYGPRAYSLRTLGHEVLVPGARTFGFSLRSTGREPLNNQPFFRYDHMTAIERVRDRVGLKYFIDGLRELESATAQDALGALAAFLRVGFEHAAAVSVHTVGEGELRPQLVIDNVQSFLAEKLERPKRAQALVAAAFDVTHRDVRSRRINDPSRDLPGDVQAYEDGRPLLSAEVRAKPVSSGEVLAFAAECRRARIDRAFVVILSPSHISLDQHHLRARALAQHDVLLTVIEAVDDLLYDIFGWADGDLNDALSTFARKGLYRLQEIEASEPSLARWAALMSGA